MRYFGLYLNNGDDNLVYKIIASDMHEAQQIFCNHKNLSLYDLLIIFNIREINE